MAKAHPILLAAYGVNTAGMLDYLLTSSSKKGVFIITDRIAETLSERILRQTGTETLTTTTTTTTDGSDGAATTRTSME